MTRQEIENYLSKMIGDGRISHAIIFDGVITDEDKEPVRAFVKEIMGSLDNGDIINVVHEKPHLISVDDIKEQVTDNSVIKPYANDYKIYIIDEAEKMNEQAQNKLLKTLEEPPSYVIIILITKNAEHFLDTIRSRCLILSMDGAGKMQYDSDELALYSKLAQDIPRMSGLEAMQAAAEIVKENKEKDAKYSSFFDIIRRVYRDALVIKEGAAVSMQLEEARAAAAEIAKQDIGKILAQLDAINRAEERVRYNVNAELTIREMIQEMKG